ncbi:MAG TPA: Ger(x)C family spore germination protein [Clostridiaceae bacterium]|nr:Ger(x)C family spore germination protein [Clostridiaceae bacterium]
MKKTTFIKTIGLIIVLIMFSVIFSGCFDRREVDELAYVMALGLDKGTTNKIRMTLQIAVPKSISGGGTGGEGGGGGKSYIITTLEVPAIYSGLNMANSYIGREIDVSHAKVIIFSEELAREGIMRYIHALMRGKEFRGNIYMAVSRGSAEEYIRNVDPKLEISPARYYEMIFRGHKHTGFGTNTQLISFYNRAESTTGEAVMIMAGVSKYEDSDEFSLEESTYEEKGRPNPFEGDYMAGDMPKVGELKSELMGLAVFDGWRMVGELDGEEALYYLMVTGEYGESFITVQDPIVEEHVVILSTRQNEKPFYKVEIVNGNPLISLKIYLEADIISIQSGFNYESTGNLPILEKTAEEQIKQGIIRLLKKTAEEMKCDIFHFGKLLKIKFLTWEEWKKFGWLDRYKDALFDVEVSLKIRRPGLMIRSIPGQASEERELN